MNDKKNNKIFIALITIFGLLLLHNSSLNSASAEASSLLKAIVGEESIYDRDRRKVRGTESLDNENSYEGTSIEIIEKGKLTKNTGYKILYNNINDTYIVYTKTEGISEWPPKENAVVMSNRTKRYEKSEYKYSKSKSFEFIEEGCLDDSSNDIIKYFVFVDKVNGQLWLLIENSDSDREVTFQPIEGSNIRDLR